MDMKTNLWPGLASYDEKGTYKFCGRNQIINDIYSLVKNHTFVTLYGKSGIGKTSILRAGVTPILKHSNFYPLYIRLSQQKGYYASSIISQIEEHLTCICTQSYSPLSADNVDYLWNWFSHNQCKDAQGNIITPVIILDQFEEIFFDNNKDAELLLRQLYCITDGSHYVNPNECWNAYQEHVRIVFSLRDDSLYHLEELINKHHLDIFRQNRYALRALNKEEALEVILLPSEGLISDSIADSIIKKVQSQNDSDSVDSAFLSLLLSELYSQTFLQGEPLTQEIVEAYSDDVIQNYYDKGIEGIEINAIQYFEEHLVSGDGRRRFASKLDMVEHGITEFDLQSLEQKHIITQLPRGQYIDYELTHDVLCGVATTHKQKRLQMLKDLANQQRKKLYTLWQWITQIVSWSILAMVLFVYKGWENVLLLFWGETDNVSIPKLVMSFVLAFLPFILSYKIKSIYKDITNNKEILSQPFWWCSWIFSCIALCYAWISPGHFISNCGDVTFFMMCPLLFFCAIYGCRLSWTIVTILIMEVISILLIPSCPLYQKITMPNELHYIGLLMTLLCILSTLLIELKKKIPIRPITSYIFKTIAFIVVYSITCFFAHGYPMYRGQYVPQNNALLNKVVVLRQDSLLGLVDGAVSFDKKANNILPFLFDSLTCHNDNKTDTLWINHPQYIPTSQGSFKRKNQSVYYQYDVMDIYDIYQMAQRPILSSSDNNDYDAITKDLYTYLSRVFYKTEIGIIKRVRYGDCYVLASDTTLFADIQKLIDICQQRTDCLFRIDTIMVNMGTNTETHQTYCALNSDEIHNFSFDCTIALYADLLEYYIRNDSIERINTVIQPIIKLLHPKIHGFSLQEGITINGIVMPFQSNSYEMQKYPNKYDIPNLKRICMYEIDRRAAMLILMTKELSQEHRQIEMIMSKFSQTPQLRNIADIKDDMILCDSLSLTLNNYVQKIDSINKTNARAIKIIETNIALLNKLSNVEELKDYLSAFYVRKSLLSDILFTFNATENYSNDVADFNKQINAQIAEMETMHNQVIKPVNKLLNEYHQNSEWILDKIQKCKESYNELLEIHSFYQSLLNIM